MIETGYQIEEFGPDPRLGFHAEIREPNGRLLFRTPSHISGGGRGWDAGRWDARRDARAFIRDLENPIQPEGTPTLAEAIEAMDRLFPPGGSDHPSVLIQASRLHFEYGYARGYHFGQKDAHGREFGKTAENEALQHFERRAGDVEDLLGIVRQFLTSLAAPTGDETSQVSV